MKVTVCELPDDRKAFAIAWEELVAYVRKQQSDLAESAQAKKTYPRDVPE